MCVQSFRSIGRLQPEKQVSLCPPFLRVKMPLGPVYQLTPTKQTHFLGQLLMAKLTSINLVANKMVSRAICLKLMDLPRRNLYKYPTAVLVLYCMTQFLMVLTYGIMWTKYLGKSVEKWLGNHRRRPTRIEVLQRVIFSLDRMTNVVIEPYQSS